ncbi:MAG: hypothetical protein ACREJN_08860 [Nitrospiraceae bacterium]
MDDLHSAMVMAALRVEIIFHKFDLECWITSANDRTHTANSKHYEGRAVDFRTHDMKTQDDKTSLFSMVKAALGPQFLVLLEDLNLSNEHLHVEFLGT